eukprot:2220357-Amphidinium_carterae.1
MGPKPGIVAAHEEEAAGSQEGKKRRFLRRNTSEQVDRVIHELFPRMSSKQIDGDKVKGKTFRESAKALKRAAKKSNKKVSRKQWQDLGAQFGGDTMDVAGLAVADKSQPVDAELKHACELAMHKVVQNPVS